MHGLEFAHACMLNCSTDSSSDMSFGELAQQQQQQQQQCSGFGISGNLFGAAADTGTLGSGGEFGGVRIGRSGSGFSGSGFESGNMGDFNSM